MPKYRRKILGLQTDVDLIETDVSAVEADILALDAAVASKEPAIAAGTTAQYWRGDKSWQTLNKAAVGLANVDNTSDAAKPISTLTQAALDDMARARYVSPKRFGALGGGVDDSAALQAFFDYLKVNGGVGRLDAMTYTISTGILVTGGTMPFTVEGAGRYQSTIKRNADIGTVLEIRTSDYVTLRDFGIDGSFAARPTSANHGLVLLDCSYATVERLHVKDHKNSAILAYATTPDTDGHVVLDDVSVKGNGATTGNGLLFVDLNDSIMRHCVVEDCAGSPGYGQQIKNDCRRCVIDSGKTVGCKGGFVFGSDGAGQGARQSTIGSVHAYTCTAGVLVGESYNCQVAGFYVDQNNAGLEPLRIEATASNFACFGGYLYNLLSPKNAIRILGSGASVRVEYVSSTSGGDVLLFDSGAANNYVYIGQLYRSGSRVTAMAGEVTYNASLTNVVEYGSGIMVESVVIASDAITVSNPKTTLVIVDTEAAAATDNLLTITCPAYEGVAFSLRTASDARDVTVTDGTLELDGAVNFVLDNSRDSIGFKYSVTAGRLVETFRSNNA